MEIKLVFISHGYHESPRGELFFETQCIVTVAVSVAVCEIFSVKEWRDLENQVRGRSRSFYF